MLSFCGGNIEVVWPRHPFGELQAVRRGVFALDFVPIADSVPENAGSRSV